MLLTAALAYARHGIPVLPVHTPDQRRGCSCDRGVRCESSGKHPRLRHGLIEASTDPRQIEIWWNWWPLANIGLRTGVVMDVADVDSVEGGHGLRHLSGGDLPPGPVVRTGGGGWHLWFRPLGFGNRVRLLPGLDWRGRNGYVVAPPSRHAAGGDYRWLRRPADDDLPAGPPALRDLIAGPPWHGHDPLGPAAVGPAAAGSGSNGSGSRGSGSRGSGSRGAGSRGAESRGFGARGAESRGIAAYAVGGHAAGVRPGGGGQIVAPAHYAAAAFDNEVDRVARAAVGCRNDTLNRAAFALGRFVGAGRLDEAEVRRELESAARSCGLGRSEIRRTLRSGLTAGRRHPFDAGSPG